VQNLLQHDDGLVELLETRIDFALRCRQTLGPAFLKAGFGRRP
jgi:hypothetical protein